MFRAGLTRWLWKERSWSRAGLICALLWVLAAPSWGQSPRATDAPRPFDYPAFSQRLLATQPLLTERPAHFVFLVDVSASVGDLLLGAWRTGLYEQMLENFMVGGDRLSVVPFGLRPWWDDAHVGLPYTRPQRAHLYTGTFPTTVKPPKFKGTDIYGSIAETLVRLQKDGVTKRDNLVLVVITDDQIQDASASGNATFQKLRESLLSASSDVLRMKWNDRKDYTVMVFTNPFPDATKLAVERKQQVEKERQAPGGGGGGGGTAPAPTASTAPVEATPVPSPSPSVEASSGFWPPPWWFWLALAAGVLALILLSRKAGGLRYKIDGTAGKLKSGERPVDVQAAGEKVGELRLQGNALVFVPRAPWKLEGTAPPSTRTSRAGAAPRGAERLLTPGRNGAWAAYDIELVGDGAAQSGSWSDATAPTVALKKAKVKIEVAELGEEAQRTQRPTRTGTKGGTP